MYLAELVEVAIGLFLVFFFVSMASSQILGTISQLLSWRSRDLEGAVRGMIAGESVFPPGLSGILKSFPGWFSAIWQALQGKQKSTSGAEGANPASGTTKPATIAPDITESLFDHPLIKPLWKGTGIKPDTIPARTFALALFDVVMSAGTDTSSIKKALASIEEVLKRLPPDNQEKKSLAQTLNEIRKLTEETAKSTDPVELANLARRLDQFVTTVSSIKDGGNRLENLRKALEEVCGDMVMPNAEWTDQNHKRIQDKLVSLASTAPDLARTLRSLISQAASDVKEGESTLAAARVSIEQWFDANMAQLTDFYRQNAKLWTGVIALVLAAMLNVDTVAITTTLWKEPTLRQSLVAYAEKLPPPEPSAQAPLQDTVTQLKVSLEGLNLPIGWDQPGLTNPYKELAAGRQPDWRNLLSRLPGWLFTALAAAQGAPFWFDIIERLLQLRGSQKAQGQEAKADTK